MEYQTAEDIKRERTAQSFARLADNLQNYIDEKYPEGRPGAKRRTRTLWSRIIESLF